MTPEEARQRAEAERVALDALRRRVGLERRYRDKNLKLWLPWWHGSDEWLATWVTGVKSHRATFATEDDLLSTLPAMIGGNRGC